MTLENAKEREEQYTQRWVYTFLYGDRAAPAAAELYQKDNRGEHKYSPHGGSRCRETVWRINTQLNVQRAVQKQYCRVPVGVQHQREVEGGLRAASDAGVQKRPSEGLRDHHLSHRSISFVYKIRAKIFSWGIYIYICGNTCGHKQLSNEINRDSSNDDKDRKRRNGKKAEAANLLHTNTVYKHNEYWGSLLRTATSQRLYCTFFLARLRLS